MMPEQLCSCIGAWRGAELVAAGRLGTPGVGAASCKQAACQEGMDCASQRPAVAGGSAMLPSSGGGLHCRRLMGQPQLMAQYGGSFTATMQFQRAPLWRTHPKSPMAQQGDKQPVGPPKLTHSRSFSHSAYPPAAPISLISSPPPGAGVRVPPGARGGAGSHQGHPH